MRVPLHRVCGSAQGSDKARSMLIAGAPTAVQYLVQRFFDAETAWQELGSTPIYALPRTLREHAASVDLVVARVQRPLARWLFDEGFVRVPEAVGAQLKVQTNDATFAGAHKTAKRNIEQVRKNQLTWCVSHELKDFEHFYDAMYVPFAIARYGESAFIRNRHALRRRFRQGGLIWIIQQDDIIAGQIFQVNKSVLHLLGPGTFQGSAAPVKQGAFSALYVFAAAYAQQKGLQWLDLGASMPSLRDGVLMHKRGWGAMLTNRHESAHDLVLRWNTFNPSLNQFFADVPLIFRDQEALSALMTLPDQEPITPKLINALQSKFMMPGLHRLYVMTENGGESPAHPEEGSKDTPKICIVKPNPPEIFRATATPCYQQFPL
jgi:hypothetical protein